MLESESGYVRMTQRGLSQVTVDASETSSNAAGREITRDQERFGKTRLVFGLGRVQCMDCGVWFGSDHAHDAHWWTWRGTVICLTVEVMEESGMTQDDEGVWAIPPQSPIWDLE